MLDVANSATVYRRPLAGSAYARYLREQLNAEMRNAPQASHALLAWLSRLEIDPNELAFGRWHGDWTPHNLATSNQHVIAWDWEHSRVDVPIGFDALHWHYQRVIFRAGLASAVAEVTNTSRRLGSLGVPPAAQGLVASLYLLEMFLRAARLAAGGGGWDPRIYPAMVKVATERDRATP